MMNIQGIMKQAQAMQKKMEEMQEKLAQEETEGVSGGGMVKVVLNGKFEMKKVTIDTSLVVADETDILEDLITAAYNDAKAKVDAKMQNSVSDMTGGLNLGGLKLPFKSRKPWPEPKLKNWLSWYRNCRLWAHVRRGGLFAAD